MKQIYVAMVMSGLLSCPVLAWCGQSEDGARRAVQAFYTAYNEGFVNSPDFAAEDWNHINPFGGRTRGREAVLKEVRAVHSTFLKGVSETVETMDVRLATPDAAVVTVTSAMSPYTTPDGTRHLNERNIRTFVVVRREGRWLVVQDQNTVVARTG